LNQRRLRLELAPSAFLAISILVLHASAALCVLAVMPGAAGLAIAALLFALGIVAAWSRALLRSSSSVRALELVGSQLEVELAGGDRFLAEVAQRRYVARFMVTLPLRRPVRRTILITPDMVGADSFRRLRIWALWGKFPVAAKQLPA
jgi:hypothetical protein